MRLLVQHLTQTLVSLCHQIQQDVVLRVAFIVDKFARDFTWCLDMVVELLRAWDIEDALV